MYRHHEADIPLIAWGKFSAPAGATLTLPFSIQAHHGFLDGYHVHQLTKKPATRIAELIA
ncbi:CatA-like O-acetyltransferase [Rugamonas sp. CCM 8940]|uniref:CatA-like O-acetyltransferase n=1 Tax=Rugamonas sp. CCM 8940 TaxID=2765359 RepID=UPI001F325E54|nr:CatA-like O-acetyltransferase [Rugamonas sp. CCM 8940]